MEEVKKISKLVLELKALLEDYLKQHTSMTLHGLSKKCGVSFSTLRRILNLETKEDPVSLTVLGIVSTVKKESNISQLMTLFSQESEVFTSLSRAYAFANKCSNYKPELAEVLVDREFYVIYKLAANASGTTRKHVRELLGNPAETKVDDLLRRELIYEDQGKLHAFQKNFSLTAAVGIAQVPEMLRFSGTGSCFVDKSIFRSVSESITKEVYDEIWQIQCEANRKIVSLINRKESIGEVPFFFVCALDTMEAPRKRPDSEEQE
ncbi:MAG: hypothetical protein HQK50_10985 [Oligoflexia bacterium]|nr:hypothetical protein [Oligoflexia bacterium]MBF0366087.1 hypothetical protein [Oligoflexia bacterium]